MYLPFIPHLETVYVDILATPAIEDIEDIATMCPQFLSNIDGRISLFIYIEILTMNKYCNRHE